ncbi:Ubiquitin carboxyl-terminal hydrolase 26 [Rhynchospora pubera]|uniref:Ubiquitin carboxyl-terminal hydrolase 26 n=1 Tax=Rhynchospora pubera TaxID=906938 RepID=A0AAV8DYC8_9POAL|nr:Ubiquitin carboxyl-terminal hydrolase 26 [Rhynchospora pubera]
MSRPNTRNKNKRHQRADDSENSLSEILRRIHSTGEIRKPDINQLYLVWKPVCQGCRVNSKDNPNCFCGLIPPSNGHRKSGLWQKNQDLVLSLGPDPRNDLRSSADTPAGLTNLGATCYANSILQCLYMNTSFRAGIFSLEPETLNQDPVLGQLAKLFAQLHSSKKGYIDSEPFIKTLELDNGVQQDGHEFLTLFLSLLERSLGHSKVSSAQTMVQDLFRGSVSHVTRCSKCGKDSEASSKMEDFYELELNIKDLKTLDESLDQYLSIEELQGENQYYCESCHARVDATRCIKLRSLPTVLNLQLKRYVFLPKTTTKKKITSSFGFPKRLDMTKRLTVAESPPPCSTSSLTYELSAILIHKGSTVNSGHYVAHIKDELTGQWWEFDDEHVSELGSHPFGEKENNSNDKNKNNTKSDVNSPSSNGKSHAEENGTKEEMFSSTDTYMFMYKLSESGIGASACTNGKMSSSLPSHFFEEIEEMNEVYQKRCEEYQRTKDEKLAYVTERREEIKSVLSEAPVVAGDDMYFWISAEWLRQWADTVNPPDLDNCSIQCVHEKIPVSRVNSAKRISAMAWQLLQSKYGGGPALSNEDYCVECLKEGAHSAVSADVYRDKKASLKQLAEDALAGKCPDSPSYFVSRTWLTHWLRRKNTEKPSENELGPTSSLRCPHGTLLPEVASGAKRVSVPEDLWLFLYETHCNSKADMDDILTFPTDSQPCEICSRELSEVACVEGNLRATKLKLKQNHEKLISGKSLVLNPEQNYNLVPASWLAKWRAFVSATGKNISSLPEPDSLEVTINSLMCEKHSKLMDRPLELVCKRGIITQKNSSTEGLTIIPEADWLLFCEEWSVPESKGISCQIALTSTSQENNNNSSSSNNNNDDDDYNNIDNEKTVVGSCKDEPISVEDMDTADEPNNNLEVPRPYIKTQPEVCEVCIGERETCALMEKLNYTGENITVALVRGKEVPKSIRDGSASFDPERRTSKRARKGSHGNNISLTVSGTTSVYQLKMMIWEAFGVVKENQKLHKGEVEIEGDMATLADKNIFPGDVLWVKDSEIHENRDIADELADGKSAHQEEEGFRGTLLTSCNVTVTNGDTSLF